VRVAVVQFDLRLSRDSLGKGMRVVFTGCMEPDWGHSNYK